MKRKAPVIGLCPRCRCAVYSKKHSLRFLGLIWHAYCYNKERRSDGERTESGLNGQGRAG